LLRYWRALRRDSQLDLAWKAGTTPRYVSFVETGRASPSRSMVLRLARALDVPLRERNELLLAAGFAPLYAVEPLDSPVLERVDAALVAMLAQHEPFPAVVMDRNWNVLRANGGAAALFGRLLHPAAVPDPASVLRLMLDPGPVRDHVTNWQIVARALVDRAKRESVGGVLDEPTAAYLDRLVTRADVVEALAAPESTDSRAPVLDIGFRIDGHELRFFSVVSTVGTPSDVTAQEIRVESFFPSDTATGAAWQALAAGP